MPSLHSTLGIFLTLKQRFLFCLWMSFRLTGCCFLLFFCSFNQRLFLSFALVHPAVARSRWLFVCFFLMSSSAKWTLWSQMRRTQFDFSYSLRSIKFLVIGPFWRDWIEGLPKKKNGRVKLMSYILVQYVSNTKRERQRVNKHFPLSLSGNFTLGSSDHEWGGILLFSIHFFFLKNTTITS